MHHAIRNGAEALIPLAPLGGITMGNMFGYQVATLGALLVAACTVYAVVVLAEKLLSQ